MKEYAKNMFHLAGSVLKYEIMGKFFAAAITVSVLGIASAIQKNGFVFNQILVCLVYFPSFYSVLWKVGNKSGKKAGEDWKGLKVGLIASLPYFITTAIVIILKLCQSSVSIFWYRIVNIQYISLLTLMFSNTNNLNEISWQAIILCCMLQFLIPLATQLAHTLGRHHFSFSERIMYKLPKQRK